MSGPIMGGVGIGSDTGADGLLLEAETGADLEFSEFAIKFAGTDAGKGT